ncbi:MAG: arylsulfatase [Planctomycetota bacterium]
MALAFSLACSCGSSVPEYEGAYKHVILISMDTTRADQIGCYGGPVAKTPNIDSLAERGILFEQNNSAASSTLASHTSMMTGLYPRRHGVARNGFMINSDNVMLAEVLGSNGFHTAGVIGSFALSELFDFDQGFDYWNQEFDIEVDMRTSDQNQRSGDQVTDTALEHLDQLDGERVFLFVHYFDVHAPYAPPEPFLSQYVLPEGPRTSGFGSIAAQVNAQQERLGVDKRAVYNVGLTRELLDGVPGVSMPGDEGLAALYQGELAYTDSEIGRLLDGLEERGMLKDSIVVLTGDHGETFWEHADFWHHGVAVYQTNSHVPLIVSMPDGRGKGTRVKQPVSGIDLFPTLLELLEIPLPEPVAGLSLVPSIDGKGPLPLRSLVSEATQPTGPMIQEGRMAWENQLKAKSIRRGNLKYIQTPYLRHEELYDLKADPSERNNLLQNPPKGSPMNQMAVLKQPAPKLKGRLIELRQGLDKWRKTNKPRDSQFNTTQMADVLDRLKTLGYVGEVEDDGHGH